MWFLNVTFLAPLVVKSLRNTKKDQRLFGSLLVMITLSQLNQQCAGFASLFSVNGLNYK